MAHFPPPGLKRGNHKSQFADNARFQLRALCKKYRLHLQKALAVATGRSINFYQDFYRRDEFHKSHLSAKSQDKYARLIFKFIEDFRNGMFDYKLSSFRVFRRSVTPFFIVVKRNTPQVKICAKKLSHCPGGFYPGDCPKNWKECLLSEAAWK